MNQAEAGNTVTAFGASLGLSDSDINGNASHNVFNGAFGLSVVDFDSQGNILSLAGRGLVDDGGVGTVPEPSSVAFGVIGFVTVGGLLLRRRAARAA